MKDQQQKKCKRARSHQKLSPEKKAELLRKRQENITRRLDSPSPSPSPSPFPSPSPSLSPSRCRSTRKLGQLHRRQATLTRQLTIIAEKENKPQKVIDRETKLKQHLDCVSNKIQSLESPSPSLSSSPSKIEQLKKRQATLTRQLTIIAEKENKPQKMIDRETKLKQHLNCVSNKIQSLEYLDKASSPSSLSPSPSSSPSRDRKIEQLKKREANINHRLSVITKKENKMIHNERKLKHRLGCVSNKIQSLESVDRASPFPSPSSSSFPSG